MSDSLTDTSARLEALETRIAHQDGIIADLNDAITGQWRKVDALERQIALLRHELQTLGPAREAQEPPPPHY